jgi:hypothetical protein
MTVYIEKPALNLREELAALRNQGGYQEQQFYFDGLVTNGTFDSNFIGWTDGSAGGSSISWNAAGYLDLNVSASSELSIADTTIATTIGDTYVIGIEAVNATNKKLFLGTSFGNNNLLNETITSAATYSFTFTASTTTSYIRLYSNNGGAGAATASFDNVSVFTSDGTDIIHTMPKGWKPKDFYEDGLLQREGAANDYEVVFDGFDYSVKPTVAPSATTQTCVIGVKS